MTTTTLAALAVFALADGAQASTRRPVVVTGAAAAVSYGSAALTGTVNDRGENATYYFQYGPTRAYGLQTVPVDVGADASTLSVSVPVSGLQPATRYHFRLVALNGTGATAGGDRSFKTATIPLSLQILGAPNPTPFGAPALIEGTLSGTGNANRAVVLQQNPFPYTQGFLNVGEPHLTTATGGFAFPVLGLTLATQFRVVTLTNPVIVSPVVIEGVAVQVTINVRRTHRRHHARIYGAITPNVEGTTVEILRLEHGAALPVASTFARRLTSSTARYSRVVRVHRGAIYEALVRVNNGALSPAYSVPVRVR
jgi:hypothetical protein